MSGPRRAIRDQAAVASSISTSSMNEPSGSMAKCARTSSDAAACRARTWRLRMEFDSWIARMRTPAPNVTAVRALQAAASEEVRTHFAIEPDGSFMLDVLMLETAAA